MYTDISRTDPSIADTMSHIQRKLGIMFVAGRLTFDHGAVITRCSKCIGVFPSDFMEMYSESRFDSSSTMLCRII